MFEASDLGVLGNAAEALGLLDGAGEVRGDWFEKPGEYMGGVVADDGQREALLEFCDEVLGGGQRDEDGAGRVWLPLIARPGYLQVFAVLDDRDPGFVAIGVGLRHAGTGPDARVEVQVPLFRVARRGSPNTVGTVFAGQPGARVTVSAAISFGEGKSGQPRVGGFELSLDLPTAADGDDEPAVSLALLGLALSGDAAPRDVRLSTADRKGLDRQLLEIVLGLVQEQAAGAGDEVAALASLLGLGEVDEIPALPLAKLFDEGAPALAGWFGEVASVEAARRAWLTALGGLLDEGAELAEEELRFTLGAAEVRIGLGLATDAGGQPLVVPRLSLRVKGSDTRQAVLRAELLQLETATASVTALPSLAAYAQLGTGDAPLLQGDLGVGSLRAGVALERATPVVVLAADGVTLDGSEFETLDLTSPGAIAEAAGKVADALVADLFNRLGPAGSDVMTLLGLRAPSGHPEVPLLDIGQFLQDPLAALRDRWRELVEKQRQEIPPLLETGRDLLLGSAQSAAGASGSGSDDDPWRVALRDGIELQAVAEAGTLRLSLAAFAEQGVGKDFDSHAELAAALVHLDFAAGSADFLPAGSASLRLQPKSSSQASLELGSARLVADRFEVRGGWSAAEGLSLEAAAPELSLDNGKPVPIDLSDWQSLERVAGALVEAGPFPADLANALGWTQGSGPRLSLAALAEDPQETLLGWLGAVAAEAEGTVASALAAALGIASDDDGKARPVAWVEPAAEPATKAERVRAGARLPFEVSADGVVASGYLNLGAVELDLSGSKPALRAAGAIRAELGVFRRDGHLVEEGELKLGRVDAELLLPLGEGEPKASLVLTDAGAFGAQRGRWEVGEGKDAAPLLPEVRALLSAAATELAGLDRVAALLSALRLLVDGGVDYDALGYLLRDPRGFAKQAAATGETELLKALDGLLGKQDGVDLDLRSRRLTVQLGDAGGAEAFRWTAEVSVEAGGSVKAMAAFGAGDADTVGALQLHLSTDPLQVAVLWNRSGDSVERVELLPGASADRLTALMRALVPAALLRQALEELRRTGKELAARLDPLLSALGLLERERVGLSLGSPADLLTPERAKDVLEALAPALGAEFAEGRLKLADGVAVTIAGTKSQPRLGLELDTAALAPGAGKGQVAVEAKGDLLLGADAPLAGLALTASVSGAGALELEAGPNGTKLGLRREGGAPLSLYPDRPGLGELVGSGAGVALARVLDALAAAGAGDAAEQVRGVVLGFGDALGLRKAGSFDSDSLLAFARGPAKEATAALKGMGAEELKVLAAGLREALPSGAEIAAESGLLRLKLGRTTIELKPDPLELEIEAADRIDPVGPLAATVRFGGDRLTEVRAEIGPAEIGIGGGALRPLLLVAVGAEPEGGRRVELGLAFDDEDADRLSARWNLGSDLELLAFDGGKPNPEAAAVALGALRALADPLAGIVLEAKETKELLAKQVGNGKGKVSELLEGVLLEPGHPDRPIADPFDLETLLERLLRLARNLGGLEPELELEGLTIGVGNVHDRLGITVNPGARFELVAGEVAVALEADGGWIDEELPPGLFVGGITDAGFEPALACAGLGIRVYRLGGPLLDAGLSLGSVAVRAFADLQPGAEGAGGLQVQLAELGVAAGSAAGGNPVGRGLLAKANGSEQLEPALSPAFAVQRYGRDVRVKLTGGDGNGPWWQPVQTAFGPLYVERVGLTADNSENRLKELGLAIDGRVALVGFQAAFDDLSVDCRLEPGKSVFDPGSWKIDLGGLALSGNVAGVSVSGGLRKVGEGDAVQYIGTLSGRYAVYGISIFGGYGEATAGDRRYATFFAFGALNAPIGGPPAFFVTGIGGGIGINRGLELPESFAEIAETPFIKALDPQAGIGADPSKDFERLAEMFPAAADRYWIAAGISFTSFALVEGVAVISVAVGEGAEVALIGLGRMALPRPEAPLASIELGMVARFSTREPVFWVQAQLTDNSWLLSRDVKLTGGYAYVVWFGGPHAGEFVLTLGGYHPDFRREGYPEVPRLGVSWKVGSSIVVKGEGYFALTSEAVMAGGRLEASADFGWAWAAVAFGADAIVFFDPGHFLAEAFATVSAGIKIKIPFKTIRVSAHLSARVRLEGPPFHGVARFEVATHEIEVAFGDQGPPELVYPDWPQFVVKYLEAEADGAARVLSAVPGRGALAPPPAADGATPDGSIERPFEVMPEFELTVTTTVPTESIAFGDPGTEVAPAEPVPPSHSLGIAPLGLGLLQSTLRLRLQRVDAAEAEQIATLQRVPLRDGRFPLGVWGPPSEPDRVPRGEVLVAANGVYLKAEAELREPLPAPVAYDKVELGKDKPRLPLPLGGPKRAPKLEPPPEEPAAPGGPSPLLSRGLELRVDEALLSGGQIKVRKMLAPRRDVDPAAERPSVETDPGTRAIVLGFGGEVLADSAAASVEIPQGGERVAMVEEAALAGSSGLHGWHAGARLAYVGQGTALFPGGSIHVPLEALPPDRRGVDSGWVDAVELTRGAAFADTRFREPLRAVAVALDRVGEGGPQPEPELTGAAAAGERIAVERGDRTYLVYPLEPQAGGVLTVTLGHSEGWSIGGVLASESATAAEFATQLGGR